MNNTLVTARLNDFISKDKNVIYCGTINLCWNELSKYLKGEITLGQSCETINYLNKKTFIKDFLTENSYLAYASFIENGILDKIKKDLKEKFNEDSKINLNPLNYFPSDILAYSFLKKILTFNKKFENIKQDLVFSETLVEAFGINKVQVDIERKLKNQVYIRNYIDPDNFSIYLKTESDDIICLVKTDIERGTIEDIINNNETFENSFNYRLQKDEILSIPKIDFDLEHHFNEMLNKDIYIDKKRTDYYIKDAVQFIKFSLDEEGAKIKSEAAIRCRFKSFRGDSVTPRQFIFDKPFLIYLKENKDYPPYFAAWISNAEILKKKGF